MIRCNDHLIKLTLDKWAANRHHPGVPPPPDLQAAPRSAARRADGVKTRNDLMDVAEDLFAASGVEAVSIRSINAAAGLAPASVHYHFGDKDGLVRAVIARRGTGLTADQAAALDQIEGRRRRPSAEEVVRLLADPLFALLQAEPVGGRRWLTIIAGLVAANDVHVYQVGFGPGSVQVRINACAAAAYPRVDAAVLAANWRMASTALLQLIAGAAAQAAAAGTQLTRAQLDTIVRFVASGLDGVCRPA